MRSARLIAILLLSLAAPAARAQGLRRFAIVAGNDSGGGDTRPLLYAGADARKVHDILTRLGGVRPEDATLLVDGRASDLLGALARVGRAAADATRHGEHTALFFYYSGHAKDGALRLGETRIGIDALKSLHRQGARRRAGRDPRLLQVGGDHAQQGGAQSPRLRDPGGQPPGCQGPRHPHLQHLGRGLAGIRRHRRQLLLAPPGERAARRGRSAPATGG